MPHDKHGNALEIGDKVSVEFTVTALYPGAEMCNVTLSRALDGEQSISVTCQTKQTEKVTTPATV